MNKEYVNCNICGKDNSQIIETQNQIYNVVKCKNCGLVFVNPQPSLTEMREDFAEMYYASLVEKQRKDRERVASYRLRKIMKYKKGEKLLDIGCGFGELLKLAKEKGWDVYGLDISKYLKNYIDKEIANSIYYGELLENKYKSDYFDVIVLGHVLEHMRNPLIVLREINRILKPNGLLFIAVPNVENYIYGIFYWLLRGKFVPLFIVNGVPTHLYHFSNATLKNMLEKNGFKVIKTTIDPFTTSFAKKIINFIGSLVYSMFRINIGNSIEMHAAKKQLDDEY